MVELSSLEEIRFIGQSVITIVTTNSLLRSAHQVVKMKDRLEQLKAVRRQMSFYLFVNVFIFQWAQISCDRLD